MSTILKCKMCGGDISVNADMSVGTCQYCGSTMTLPRIDTDKKARLFNHANQYRLNCEFDKAFEAYHMISEEDETEPEAYWGMLLSEYGVEYVEDPETKKRIPTCHRTIVKPVKSNTHYELAYKYADTEGKLLYQDEAEVIDGIQRKIVSISSKEEPYDVFICYKETDDDTKERTTDSVIAQEIYTELDKMGLKVFFSRITLADKLGADYEPYIYSALRSAKVMLVVGTTGENVNSTWVRNEWKRFIQFMSDDSGKVIIPVYKAMDAYALPDELSRFQGQDIEKVGALQDLVFSVSKIVKREEQAEQNDVLNSLIKERLEKEKKQKEWEQKKSSASKAAKKAGIILAAIAGCILLVIAAINIKEVIAEKIAYKEKLEQSYEKAKSFAEKGQYERAYTNIIDEEDFQKRDPNLYKYIKAIHLFSSGDYNSSKQMFEELGDYADSNEYIKKCDNESSLATYNNLLSGLTYEEIDDQAKQLEDICKELEMDETEAHNEVFKVRFEGLLEEENYTEASEYLVTYRYSNEEFVKEYTKTKQIGWYNTALELLDKEFDDSTSREEAYSLLRMCHPTYLETSTLLNIIEGNYDVEQLFSLIGDSTHVSIKYIVTRLIWLYADRWLVGTWKSSEGYYFTYQVDGDGTVNTTYNLPALDTTNTYFYISYDGIYYIYDKADTATPPESQRRMFKFTLFNSKEIAVRCFKDSKTYVVLHKQ